jgi:hypothetical protein
MDLNNTEEPWIDFKNWWPGHTHLTSVEIEASFYKDHSSIFPATLIVQQPGILFNQSQSHSC